MTEIRTIEDCWRRSKVDGNNFDALRLVAAIAVIFSHSFHVVAGESAEDPLGLATGGESDIGRLSVMTFFVLSGFLLTKSWRSEPSLAAFVSKRALRIFPALIAVVIAWTFVLGPIVSADPAGAYFASAETWRYLANLVFYTGYDNLPGVFEQNPYPGVVNGPLWTLKFEVMCYLALALAAILRALRPAITAMFIAALYAAALRLDIASLDGAAYYLAQFADLARPFFFGALFALLGDRIALTPLAAAVCAVALFIAAMGGYLSDAFPAFGGYLVLFLGFARLGPLRRAGAAGDFSYGLYVWGLPCQQIVEAGFGFTNWWANLALALPLAFLCAALSWRFIERPALRLKRAPVTVFRPAH